MDLLVVAPYLFVGRPEYSLWEQFSDYKRVRIYRDCHQKHMRNPLWMDSYYLDLASELLYYFQVHDVPSDILWLDGWNPVVPLFVQHLQVRGKSVKHHAYFHGRLLDTPEMLALEKALLSCYTNVFVATRSYGHRIEHPSVKVVGMPVDLSKCWVGEKKPRVVYPHRISPEKKFELFLKLAEECNAEWDFVVVGPAEIAPQQGVSFIHAPNKDTYYRVLAESSHIWSGATETGETLGVAVMEGVSSGCIPIVPDIGVYRELYGPIGYRSYPDMIKKLRTLTLEDLSVNLPTFDKEAILKAIKQ